MSTRIDNDFNKINTFLKGTYDPITVVKAGRLGLVGNYQVFIAFIKFLLADKAPRITKAQLDKPYTGTVGIQLRKPSGAK